MTNPPDVQVVACTDGPLLVRGAIELVNSDGDPVTSFRSTVALCRCGVSALKPFCDGTHKIINFKTTPPGSQATL